MRTIITLGGVALLLASAASGQDPASSRTKNQVSLHDEKEPAASTRSYRSFHELLAKKDKQIVQELTLDDNAYVCFLPHEDTFLIARYHNPAESDWLTSKIDDGDGEFYAYGYASLRAYVDGQEDFWHGVGPLEKWKAWGHRDAKRPAHILFSSPGPMFSGSDNHGTSFFIDASEFKLYFTTDYGVGRYVTIRLSTGRFWFSFTESDKETTSGDGRCEIYYKGIVQQPWRH